MKAAMSVTRYIVSFDRPPTAAQSAELVRIVREKGAGWWKWYPGTLAIRDRQGRTAKEWYELLRDAYGGNFVIFGATGGWWGRSDSKHYKWLHETFTPD